VDDATSSDPTAQSHESRSRSSIDVRQQLAADQTLLAWVRTAIALAALGFVVARFNVFLREVQHVSTASWGVARGLGLALVVLAALVLIIGLFQHRQVSNLLVRDGDPLVASKWPAVAGGGGWVAGDRRGGDLFSDRCQVTLGSVIAEFTGCQTCGSGRLAGC
jgi:putative membrane protein